MHKKWQIEFYRQYNNSACIYSCIAICTHDAQGVQLVCFSFLAKIRGDLGVFLKDDCFFLS
ncbi:MAG: hypothetical protein DWQ10_09395 [Calditrichaeota bacterium]|nr:MAG: hypothetical protein DWQ10_09395 [Calditrichota bacterium]